MLNLLPPFPLPILSLFPSISLLPVSSKAYSTSNHFPTVLLKFLPEPYMSPWV